MSITLKSLYYETKNKYKLKLIAGESGIDNVVSWFHFMEDESTINFIRGNELIVTTGLGSKNNNWLDNLRFDKESCMWINNKYRAVYKDNS